VIIPEWLKLLQNKEIYSDDEGKLIGWEQPNGTVVLFSGDKKAEHVEALEQTLQFPTDAVPELIKFLEDVIAHTEERERINRKYGFKK